MVARKEWFKEPHNPSLLGEIAFWRHYDSGFVAISTIEKGAPASYKGDKYMVNINTPRRLDTSLVKTLPEAKKVANQYMKTYDKYKR